MRNISSSSRQPEEREREMLKGEMKNSLSLTFLFFLSFGKNYGVKFLTQVRRLHIRLAVLV